VSAAAASGDAASALAAPADAALLGRALAAGPLVIEARGVSMRPWLRPGDRVQLETRPPRLGDVALVRSSGRLVLHRLRRRRGRHWLVQGDARPRPDGWIEADAILGVAVARARAAAPGRWARMDGAGQRWLALVAAPLLDTLRRGRARLRRGARV